MKVPLPKKVKCLICGNKCKFLGYGVIAPWISELTKNSSNFTQLLQCLSCSFTFFSHRYNDSELKCIYSKYRSDEYFKIRNYWEFWYTKRENQHYLDEKYIIKRKENILKILNEFKIKYSPRFCFVDYGGDHGQFIPNTPLKNYVIEFNTIPQTQNVYFVQNFEEIRDPILVIVNRHVLEHVVNPVNLLKLFKKNLHPKQDKIRKRFKSIVITELPIDMYKVSKFARTTLYFYYLNFLLRHDILFKSLDFISGVFRQFFNYLPPFGIIKQSEHINYFNETSIKKIFETSGLNIVKIESGHYVSGKIKFKTSMISAQRH